MLDRNILKRYASQSWYNCYNHRLKTKPNGFDHEEIYEMFKQLTLKHGNRLYRLKDVSYFSFEAKHFKDNDGKSMYTVVYFEIQKDCYSKHMWQNITQKFRLNIIHNKNLGKYHWDHWSDVPKVRKNRAVIDNRDFKFNSIINFSTKDIYEKGDKTW